MGIDDVSREVGVDEVSRGFDEPSSVKPPCKRIGRRQTKALLHLSNRNADDCSAKSVGKLSIFSSQSFALIMHCHPRACSYC